MIISAIENFFSVSCYFEGSRHEIIVGRQQLHEVVIKGNTLFTFLAEDHGSASLAGKCTPFQGTLAMNLIDSVPEDEPTTISKFDLNFPKISIDSIAPMSVMKNPVTLLEAQKQKSWMKTNPGVEPYRAWEELTYVGVPLFLAGIIAKGEKKSFQQNDPNNKHTLVTDFKTRIDDYAQFFGPLMTTGLKLGGVEGRSSWGRYLATFGMSYGIMAAFVNSIKYTSKEMRPDGSTANSWPSGHTATAFVGATLLHKEYGLTRSPWYSVAGYGVATATGIMRVLNNRHWVSDVLSGAGIGILSGEIAYALSDVIFKERGLLRGNLDSGQSIIYNPSFFSISMGVGLGSKNLEFDLEKMDVMLDDDGDKKLSLKFGSSTVVGAEGAYFFNKYFGVGGRLRINSSPIKGWSGIEEFAWRDLVNTLINEDLYNIMDVEKFIGGEGVPGEPGYSAPLIDELEFNIKSDHITEFAGDLGVYFNFPLSDRFAIGSKLLIGHSVMQEVDLNARITGGKRDLHYDAEKDVINVFCLPETYTSEFDYFTMGGNNTMKYGTGISLTYAYKENYAWRLFLDYDFTKKTYTMEYNPGVFLMDAVNLKDEFDLKETQEIKKNRDTFIIGGSLTISF